MEGRVLEVGSKPAPVKATGAARGGPTRQFTLDFYLYLCRNRFWPGLTLPLICGNRVLQFRQCSSSQSREGDLNSTADPVHLSIPNPSQEVVKVKLGVARLSLIAMFSILLVTFLSAAQKRSNWDATDDQKPAVGCIRSINTSELYYAKEYKQGWSPTLAALGAPPEGGKPSAAAASLLDSSLTSGKRNNYVFTYNAGKPDASGKINTYTLSVQPVEWHSGLWNFFDDDSGIIRGTEEKRAATVNDPPLQ